MTRMNTPLACGLTKYCALVSDIEFIGKQALLKQREAGVPRRLYGLVLNGDPVHPATAPWTVFQPDVPIGDVTSAVYSPRFRRNIAFAMLSVDHIDFSSTIAVEDEHGNAIDGYITELPFDTLALEAQLTA